MGVIKRLLERFDLTYDEVLTYRCEKTVTIQNWQVGLFYRAAQLSVVVFVILTLWVDDTWAKTEKALGTVNAYAGSGTWADLANTADFNADIPYCGNAAYDFVYDADYQMLNPACVAQPPYEISMKGKGQLSFTTAYQEMHETGWPCNDVAVDTMERAACLARGGAVTTSMAGLQCACDTMTSVLPVGVEKMKMSFEHSASGFDRDIQASSSTHSNQPGGIYTKLMRADGSEVGFEGGREVSLTVEDWLMAAGVGLDFPHTAVTADARDPAKYPMYRTTGVLIELEVKYDNLDKTSEKPTMDLNKHVRAQVTPRVVQGQWSGDGPKVHYVRYPEPQSDGSQRYEKIFRYRQGVTFSFQTTGVFHKFDGYFMMNVVISALVLLSTANTLAAVFATYIVPNAEMIRNRCREEFNVKRRYAEIGMKSALASVAFNALDQDGDGHVQDYELCATFGRIPGVSFDQALAMAQLVINSADATSAKRKPKKKKNNAVGDVSVVTDTNGDAGTVDFGEFMLSSESGKMITWQSYLDVVEGMVDEDPNIDRDKCKKHYEEAVANRDRSREARIATSEQSREM